jgi:myo-inositol-1(or 4)-monophosphatase
MREELFRAEAGGGAFLNDRAIRVSRVKGLGSSLLATGFPYDVRKNPVNNLDHWGHFLVRAQAVRRCGSAALDLCYVACGRFDGFWELRLNPWDVAAGGLIVRASGGLVTDFSGGDFGINDREILASNGAIHREMLDVLKLGGRIKGKEGKDEET